MRIGFYQFEPAFGQVDRNLGRVLDALRSARADLIVLPELALTGYYFRDRDELEAMAEDPDNSTSVDALTALCRAHDLYLVTGFAEKRRDRCFNSALLLGPSGLLHTYRKIHLFGTERRCFDPGDVPLRVSQVRDLSVGLMVCFDWAFPEVARSLALLGADAICHPANLVLPHCQQAMLARCLENRVFAVTANRYGVDERPHGAIAFTGGSQVVGPSGELIHRAPSAGDELYVTEIDPHQARDKRLTSGNDLFADRRPSFYRALCEERHIQ